jgi:hypothetical protein
MATTQVPPRVAGEVKQKLQSVVRVKQNWSDPWETLPYSRAVSVDAVVAGRSSARFLRNYGNIKWQEHIDTFRRYPVLSLENWFVQISTVQESRERVIFVGIITDDTSNIRESTGGTPTGDQVIEARGLEHLLDLLPIIGGVATKDGTTTFNIDQAPSFNGQGGFGLGLIGNRTASPVAALGVNVFSSAGYVWTNLDILQYVLTAFTPHPQVSFALSGQYSALDEIQTIHYLEGLTIYQMLNHLVSKRRGLQWSVRTTGAGTANIHISTAFSSDVLLDGAVLVPANPEQFTVSADNYIDIPSFVRTRQQVNKADYIAVTGEAVKSCFTVSFTDSNLEAGWSAAQETAYKDDPTGAGAAEQDAILADEARRGDRNSATYQKFRIPLDWDGNSGDGQGGLQSPALPVLDFDGEISTATPAELFRFGKVFERMIPIEKSIIGPTGEVVEYKSPLYFMDDPENAGKFIALDEPAGDALSRPPVMLRMSDTELSFNLRAAVPHIVASANFDEATALAPTNTAPVYDFNSLVSTLFLSTDQKLKIVRAATENPSEQGRWVHIDVDGLELWYIADGTVIDIQDGELVSYVYDEFNNGILRDDRDRLKKVAAFAAGWYGENRSVGKMVISDIVRTVQPGAYIKTLVQGTRNEDVNAVVVRVSYRFGESPKTEVEWGALAVDPRLVADFPGMSSPRAMAKEVRRIRSGLLNLQQRTGNLFDRMPQGPAGGASSDSNRSVYEYALPTTLLVDAFE